MKATAIMIGAALLLCGAGVFWPFCFSYDSVCSKCGASRYTREWQLPHSQHSLFAHSQIVSTPLSQYLSSSGMVQAHSHQWLFGHGGGNGVRCALGDGDSIRSSVWSHEVTNLLDAARRYGEEGEASKLLRLTFDRDLSRTVRSLASFAPTNGFASREAYRSWISEQAYIIDQGLEMAGEKK